MIAAASNGRPPISLDALWSDARAGAPGAAGALAFRLLAGEGDAAAVRDGLDLLGEAARRDGQSACALATLIAAGVGAPQDLRRALATLAEAAALGSDLAKGQLLALGAKPSDSDWRAAAIDPAGLLALPPLRALSDAPRIRTIERFLSPAMCAWLIGRARNDLIRARTYDVVNADGVVSALRTNTERVFRFFDLDVVLVLAQLRMSLATKASLFAMEEPTVLHYEPGEQFHRHYDYLDPSVPGQKSDLDRRGQRVATFLVSLNADYEGGETEFPLIGVRYKGGVGDALVFANVDRSQAPDRLTLHAGLPPTSGQKWMLSQWIRGGPRPA
jgi:predicted 2-oxoglutarate/Fe(II)-dependent dioxygenase YbiX